MKCSSFFSSSFAPDVRSLLTIILLDYPERACVNQSVTEKKNKSVIATHCRAAGAR